MLLLLLLPEVAVAGHKRPAPLLQRHRAAKGRRTLMVGGALLSITATATSRAMPPTTARVTTLRAVVVTAGAAIACKHTRATRPVHLVRDPKERGGAMVLGMMQERAEGQHDCLAMQRRCHAPHSR